MKTYRLHDEARKEFERAQRYIEKSRVGEGSRFRLAILEGLRRIIEAPDRWPERNGFRKYLVPTFNYQIVYRIDGGNLFVVAIAHPSRKPGYWKERVLDEQR